MIPTNFPSSTTGNALKSCLSNNSASSRIVVCRLTVITGHVINCLTVHPTKPYIASPALLFACIASPLHLLKMPPPIASEMAPYPKACCLQSHLPARCPERLTYSVSCSGSSQLDTFEDERIIVFWFVHARRDGPHPHRLGWERPHQVTRIKFVIEPAVIIAG